MKISVTSDIHGYLPIVPECDLFIIAGDLTFERKNDFMAELKWYNRKFVPYLQELNDRNISVLFTAGNHCGILERHKDWVLPLLPANTKYLENESIIWNGIKMHFSPNTPTFYNWAFNNTEIELKRYWDLIPDDTNILVTHGPPRGILDKTDRGEEVGSYTLRNRIENLKDLRYHCFGHIHFSSGEKELNGVKFHNVSYTNEDYRPAYQPIILEIKL